MVKKLLSAKAGQGSACYGPGSVPDSTPEIAFHLPFVKDSTGSTLCLLYLLLEAHVSESFYLNQFGEPILVFQIHMHANSPVEGQEVGIYLPERMDAFPGEPWLA